MNFVPNVPTFKEQGIYVVVDLWRWIAVPKGTPPERVKVLSAALKNILSDKPTLAAMEKIGFFVSYLPPEYEEVKVPIVEVLAFCSRGWIQRGLCFFRAYAREKEGLWPNSAGAVCEPPLPRPWGVDIRR
jgi:hypothetical protein